MTIIIISLFIASYKITKSSKKEKNYSRHSQDCNLAFETLQGMGDTERDDCDDRVLSIVSTTAQGYTTWHFGP